MSPPISTPAPLMRFKHSCCLLDSCQIGDLKKMQMYEINSIFPNISY